MKQYTVKMCFISDSYHSIPSDNPSVVSSWEQIKSKINNLLIIKKQKLKHMNKVQE